MTSLFSEAGVIDITVPWGQTATIVGQVFGGTAGITSAGTPTGGTFTASLKIPITGGGTKTETTAAIAYNAAAATIQSALIDLPGVSAGEIVCSGGALPTQVVVTFALGLAGLDPLSLTVDDTLVTGGTNAEIEVVRLPQDLTGWTVKLKVVSDLTSSALEPFELTATLTDAANGKISFSLPVSAWTGLSATISAYAYACNKWQAILTGGPSSSEQYNLARGTFSTEPIGIPA